LWAFGSISRYVVPFTMALGESKTPAIYKSMKIKKDSDRLRSRPRESCVNSANPENPANRSPGSGTVSGI
jgi:hypothetical protein